MKLVPVAVTGFAVLVVGLALTRMHQVHGQQPMGALTPQEPAAVPPANPAYGNYIPNGANPFQLGTRSRFGDTEMDKLRGEEVKLEHEVGSLLREYAQAKEEEQQGKIKAKLSAVLEKQFDLQQKRRKLELDRIEAELKMLRQLMQKRTDARKTIVEKRLDQLVREAEGLGWTSPSNGPHVIGQQGIAGLRAR